MKKRKLLFLPLLLWAVTVMAEQPMVPAMIVYGTNGNRQVVQLDATDVTDLVVLQNGQSLKVDIPEAQVNGVRSIIFAIVAIEEITTAIENTENPIIRKVEKVVRDGQVFIRLLLPDGTTLEYDMRGNLVR